MPFEYIAYRDYEVGQDDAALTFTVAWIRKLCGPELSGTKITIQEDADYDLKGNAFKYQNIVLEYPDDQYVTEAGWAYVAACRRAHRYFHEWYTSELVTDAWERIRGQRIDNGDFAGALALSERTKIRKRLGPFDLKALLAELITDYCYPSGTRSFESTEEAQRNLQEKMFHLADFIRRETAFAQSIENPYAESPRDLSDIIIMATSEEKLSLLGQHIEAMGAPGDCFKLIEMLDPGRLLDDFL
ncbi:MAG: hypothetical protein IT514_13715 [Burkholderiales bacterium]|nr:hypothetical protein [Burkholderiales bacterium]